MTDEEKSGPKGLNDTELVTLLKGAVSECVSYDESELSSERAEVQQYYDGALPARKKRSNSTYVSLDVYDSVEAAKAAIIEPFTGGNHLGKFTPTGADDVQSCLEATAYCNHVIFQQNDGDGLMEDIVEEGLMNRNGIAKVYWDDESTESEVEYTGIPYAEYEAFIAHDAVLEVLEESVDPSTLEVTAKIVEANPAGRVRIDILAPEEFGISSRAKSLKDADVIYHRQLMSLSDLRDMGLTDAELSELTTEDGTDFEEQDVRFDEIGAELFTLGTLQEEAQKTWVYEVYANLDIEGTGIVHRYRVLYTGNLVLEVEKNVDLPFIVYCPLRRRHSFWGNSFAKKVIPTQKTKTALTRGIVDHTIATNNPRYEVVKGTLKNPRELTDDRYGGFVNVNRPEGIKPLPQAGLNSFVFQTIQLLDQDLEDTTGVSRMATGLNRDAISKQNSEGMVGQLTHLSQTRLRMMARRFVTQFIRELYVKVYGLVLQHEDTSRIVQVAGSFTRVRPNQWKTREDFSVDVALSEQDREKEINHLLTLDAYLREREPMLYTQERRYALLKRVFDLRGWKDTSSYLAHPSEIEPPKPDPMAMKDLELRERELAIRERAQAMAEQKLQLEALRDQRKLQLQDRKDQIELALKGDGHELAERKQEHIESTAAAELEVLKRDTTEVRGIASPA